LKRFSRPMIFIPIIFFLVGAVFIYLKGIIVVSCPDVDTLYIDSYSKKQKLFGLGGIFIAIPRVEGALVATKDTVTCKFDSYVSPGLISFQRHKWNCTQ
jgi:hypothetical protein